MIPVFLNHFRRPKVYLADIALPFKDECEHFLIAGKTGSGKSQAINQMLGCIRARPNKALLADADGDHLSRFYKPGDLMQESGMKTAELKDMQRQKDPVLAQAARLSVEAPHQALEKLKVVEIRDDLQRRLKIAEDFAGLSLKERRQTIILSGTHAGKDQINGSVREKLGLLGQGVEINVFYPKDLTQEQRSRLENFEAGDLVRFERAYKGLGVKRGDVCPVIKVEESSVSLEKSDGECISLMPHRLNGANFTIGNRVQLEVAFGESVRFTATDRELGYKNGQRVTVKAIDSNQLTLLTAKSKTIKIAQDRILPLDYSYAATGHSAQGLGAKRVLLEKETTVITTNHRAFYTDLTRAQYEAAVYTNDHKALPEAVIRLSEKTRAIDVVASQRTQLDREKTQQREYGR